MKQTRYTEAQIVDILAQAAKGEMTAIEVCRINGISEQTFYRWKRRYGDMQVSEVRRLRELEAENARLKRLLAERDLEIDAITRRAPGKMSGAPEKRHTVRVLAAAGISTRRACASWAPRAPISPTRPRPRTTPSSWPRSPRSAAASRAGACAARTASCAAAATP